MEGDRKPIPNLVEGPGLPVLACSLDAGDQVDRLREWRLLSDGDVIVGHTVSPGRLEVRYRLDPDRVDELRRLAEAERCCCAFAEFTLTTREDAVVLTVTGPPGTETFFRFLTEPVVSP
jgi:hypothetical protein